MVVTPNHTPQPPQPPRCGRVWAWLQLFRAPNLLTVPGDPVAGFLLASAMGPSAARPMLSVALAAAVSVLIYAAGLAWNDLFDLAEDRRERPGRPLPSGAIRPATAAAAASILALLAMGLAAILGTTTLYVAIALGALALAYDAVLKRIALVGPLAMGACRGLSALVGAAALGPAGLAERPVLAFAGGLTVYIAAVTVLAAGEMRPTAVRAKVMLIITMAAAWLMGLLVTVPPASMSSRWAMTAFAAASVIYLTRCLAKLGGDEPDPPAVQRAVGGAIRTLVLLQATAVVCVSWTAAGFAAGLLACFLVNALLARRFYSS